MISPEELASQLNLDGDEAVLSQLIQHAQAIIRQAVNLPKPDSELADNPLYVRCVYTLATQFYFDRTLDSGLSNGMRMMLCQLGTSLGVESDEQDSGSTVSNAESVAIATSESNSESAHGSELQSTATS